MRQRMLAACAITLATSLVVAACGSSGADTANSSGVGSEAGAQAAAATNGAASGESTSADAADAAAPEKVTIMVGGLDKQIYLPAELTKDLGYFDEEGIDVDLQSEPAGVDAETAMLSGSVDAVVGFYDHNIQLQVKGKTTESIVQFSQVPGEVELTSNKATDVHSPADWKGKSVGITGAGSSTDFLTQYLAVKSGLQVGDVSRQAVKAGQTFIAAMTQGTIVSGMTTEPTITQAVNSGLAHVGKEAYAKALDDGKGMFTADGVMPSDGPATVLSVLSMALPEVAKANVDLSKTYTTEFVKNVPAA